MRFRIELICLLLSGAAAAGSVHARGPLQQNDDVLLKAMRDELARSAAQLKLESLDKPYYIEYAVTDSESFDIDASFGAVVRASHDRSRPARVTVRAGGYDLDNTGFVSMRSMMNFEGRFPRELVTEDDYSTIRRDLWLATDTSYKAALEQLAQKRAFKKTKIEGEQIPDFSREEPRTSIASRRIFQCDQAKLKDLARRLSAILREYPVVYESGIRLSVRTTNKYFVNSEGAVIREPASLVTLNARASTQAADGMRLKNFVSFAAPSIDELAPEAEIASAIRGMAQDLTDLTAAPVLEKYTGPVLLIGQASSEMFAQALGPQLSGDRPPLFDQPQMAAMAGQAELADRLNLRVLPTFLNALDDPTARTFDKQALIGAYNVDDEGIAARPAPLIEHGVLKTLLMSRRPRKEFPQSNGHGRAGIFGPSSSAIGNLILRTTEGKSFDDLKQELLRLCRAQGLPYGVMIKSLDDPGITGRDTESMVFSMSGGEGRQAITSPILVYKIYAEGGRQELVRGANIVGLSARTLKDIVAAGSDSYVLNKSESGGSAQGIMSIFSGGAGIPCSVIAPSVLFEELELKRGTGPVRKPALLEHPGFAK